MEVRGGSPGGHKEVERRARRKDWDCFAVFHLIPERFILFFCLLVFFFVVLIPERLFSCDPIRVN